MCDVSHSFVCSTIFRLLFVSIRPAIPAVVNAIAKPADTYKAVEELMATTFVATVDASTLSILCPILSRCLKEKNAVRKRSSCVVIENMSRLVDSPNAVAPFGPLLVPELKKVSCSIYLPAHFWLALIKWFCVPKIPT